MLKLGVKTAATAATENVATIAANANCRPLTTALIFFVNPTMICLILMIFLLSESFLIFLDFFLLRDFSLYLLTRQEKKNRPKNLADFQIKTTKRF